MPSPFPGLDPYLEQPEFWSEVHHRLIVAIADAIAAPLRPAYYVAIEKRTDLSEPEDSVLVGIADVAVLSQAAMPDSAPELPAQDFVGQSAIAILPTAEPLTVTLPLVEEVRESYLEIRERITSTVITTIEILSPKNKRSGEGRAAYLRKRNQVLASATHLVEIDFLRSGASMPIQGMAISDYRILISRGDRRPTAQLYAFSLRQAIPLFPLPLQANDIEPVVDLKVLLEGVYDRAGYDLRLDYTQPLQPPLSAADAAWVAERLLARNEED